MIAAGAVRGRCRGGVPLGRDCRGATALTLSPVMGERTRDPLGVIAGRGAYPLVLARAARDQGVPFLFAVAFKRETDRAIEELVDEVHWLPVGRLKRMLDAFTEAGVRQVVMAGQITPTHLFRVRPDRAMIELLAGLHERNAHTIFAAVGEKLAERGIALQPASLYMESAMPEAGVLTRRAPTEAERADIALGVRVARTTSDLDIGQTVVVKEGVIVAVEALEGTDAAIRRAGELAGPGVVVVKAAKRGHDMRFDIPVVGEQTLKVLKKEGAAVLAIEAGRSILLDRDRVIEKADQQGLSIVALAGDEDGEDRR